MGKSCHETRSVPESARKVNRDFSSGSIASYLNLLSVAPGGFFLIFPQHHEHNAETYTEENLQIIKQKNKKHLN